MKEEDYREAEDLFEMALQWIEHRQPDRAIPLLKNCIELNGNFIYAYVTLAEALAKTGDMPQAVSVLKQAARRDPDFDRLYYLIARYAFKMGDLPKSLKYMKIARERADCRLYERSEARLLRAVHGPKNRR